MLQQDGLGKRPQVLLVCGSTSATSRTRVLLRALEDVLSTSMTVRFWDFSVEPLPIADPAFHHRPLEIPDATALTFIRTVMEADAIALGSPLYHGSYSGVLKNALDHLGWDAFRGKPVALLSHGTNATRCAQPVEHLQSVVRTLYGANLQTQVCTSKADYSEHEGGVTLTNPDILERLSRLADELASHLKHT